MSDPSPEAARKARWADEVRTRLAALRLSPAREAEIVDELAQHLEDHYRELRSAGTEPDDAMRLTLAQFRSGNVLARYMAPLRQSNSPPPVTPGSRPRHLLGGLWQDLRYAARAFWKQPAFASTAVLTLALGIGASTAIFSVVYGVLLKPLPFAEPERLVTVLHGARQGIGRNHGPTTYFTYRENQRVFEDIGAWDDAEVSITGRGDPERVPALLVNDATLPLLRVHPIAGRLFTAEDVGPGGPLRVMLTNGYWQHRFGGAESAIGDIIVIDGRPAEVIGVLPSSFRFLRLKPVVLLPMQLDPSVPRGISFGFQVLSRLKPGVTLAQANDDLARMIPLLPSQFAPLELFPDIRPLAADVIGNIGDILWILLAAVGVVQLIACGNVANLFLVRAEGRHQELAMRAALGASRVRLARTLLSETVLLAVAGGAVGMVLAEAGIRLLRVIAPAQLPRVDEIAIDVTVLLFTLSISVVAGVLCGMVAVFRFGAPGLPAIKEGGRSASDAPGRHRARHVLVVTQIALALILLIVSGLMIRTFVALREVDPGFTGPEEVQTFRVAIPSGLISDSELAARTHLQIAERLAQVPGVISIGASTSITMDGENNLNYIEIEGIAYPEGQLAPLRRFKSIAPGYVETMGNRLAAGRSITWSEILERRPVIMISEPLARRYWQAPAAALGKHVRNSSTSPWREIVGVVANERDDGLNLQATEIVYWPMQSEGYRWRTMAYAVRSSRVGAAGFVRELQHAVWSVNPNLPLANIETLAEIQSRSMAQTSFAMTMLVIAASVALLIGVVGIYGVIAYVAAQRTREIGIRIALGAQFRDVRRIFVGQGLWLTGAGIAVGVALALPLTRVMSAFLFGIGPMDPATYAGVSALLAAVAFAATYLPARRVARVDPLIALRADV